jgi:DNA-binding MltR family transcriptional regulator
MSDRKYLTDLKKYGAGDPSEDDLKALEEELYEGPDRAMAVVMGSLVEKSIEKLLQTNMRREVTDELFKPSGLLGDFNSKIDISYAMQLIGPLTYKDLTIIRHLRNQFAHSRRPIEFTTHVVDKCCAQLKLPDMPGVLIPFHYLNNVSDSNLESASDKKHPRTRFMITCNEIVQRVYLIRGGDLNDPMNQFP